MLDFCVKNGAIDLCREHPGSDLLFPSPAKVVLFFGVAPRSPLEKNGPEHLKDFGDIPF